MIQRIATIAYGTYREAVRARILLGLAGVGFAVAGYSLVVGAFTLNEAPRVVADLGAMAVSVFSIAIAILIGATTLYRELELKTILPLLARPIRRGEFLVGKYLGIMLVVAVFAMAECGLSLLMSGAFAEGLDTQRLGIRIGTIVLLLVLPVFAIMRSSRVATLAPIPWSLAVLMAGLWLSGGAPAERSLITSSALLTIMEVGIIAAVAMVFSSFSTPFLSAMLTMGVFLVGRSADTMSKMPVKVFGKAIHDGARALSTVVPNLHVYTPARPLLTGEAADANLLLYLAMAALQTLGWTVGLLAVAAFVFQRRDFT
jgi:ABC-type transport system involved in multi-copper enzyme maturation permease subunit